MSQIDSGYNHSFPAVRGTQAGRQFFIATCPLRIIPKIFIFDEEEVPPELRAQRTLNRARVPEISAYLADNPKSYVLSALTASVGARVKFHPHAEDGPQSNVGILHIPMDASILINDGQHRRAAIEEALHERPELGHDNVAVLFFVDEGLRRSQQIFADLNKHAVRPSGSLSTLYDHRDPCSELARYVAMKVPAFVGTTEMEKSSISHRSSKLFTLSSIKNATRALLRKGRRQDVSDSEKGLAVDYWTEVASQMPDWGPAKERRVNSAELRQNFVHVHGVALHALGIVGVDLISSQPQDWPARLKALRDIDWSRSNTQLWEGRAMVMGKISKARNNVQLTANAIKHQLGLSLTPDEQALEEEFNRNGT